ncbi:hypothetical protein C8F04DRAFT_1181107 [Mycena alexandri]|uniref:Uncharacterized protein n=1 Tax=Mycena alexandri TaxID=1745969 RepID=A0AAD6SZN9_9AGAR|nr:hypothetical protein C8F04DRAFT_1181107 [Mycena alexandri]
MFLWHTQQGVKIQTPRRSGKAGCATSRVELELVLRLTFVNENARFNFRIYKRKSIRGERKTGTGSVLSGADLKLTSSAKQVGVEGLNASYFRVASVRDVVLGQERMPWGDSASEDDRNTTAKLNSKGGVAVTWSLSVIRCKQVNWIPARFLGTVRSGMSRPVDDFLGKTVLVCRVNEVGVWESSPEEAVEYLLTTTSLLLRVEEHVA